MTDSNTKKDPIVICRRSPEGRQLVFDCPYCERPHYHGSCGPEVGAGNGHRLPHCTNPESPYQKTGYILVEEQHEEKTND